MSEQDSLPMALALLVARGELSATAYFEVIDRRAERWVRRALRRLDEHATLRYPDVVRLLAASIAVVAFCAVAVAVTAT